MTKRKKRKLPGNIFDDVMKTLQVRHPDLLVPIINEIFGTNYPENAVVVRLPAAYHKRFSKVIADSCVLIGNHVYHLETQSVDDETMIIRMVEYDFMIGLSTTKREDGRYQMRMPRSAVIYLRGRKDDADSNSEEMDIILPDGQTVNYRVPTVYVQKYELDEIFDKKLYAYLPFYMMRYENRLKAMEKDVASRADFLEDIKELLERVDEALDQDPGEYQDMLYAMRCISDYLLSDCDSVKTEVEKIMGGRILPMPSDALRKAEARGRTEGRAEGKTVYLILQIQRKITRGKTLAEIAEELEDTEEAIRPLYEAVQKYGADCSAEEIYGRIMESCAKRDGSF